MKSFKISLICLAILFKISLAYAQEDEEVSNPKTFLKRVHKRESRSVFDFNSNLSLGYDTNVFRTPTGVYVDPETGLDNQSSPTAAPFVHPDLTIKWNPLNRTSHVLSLEGGYDGIFYSGNQNEKNANGYDGTISLSYRFQLRHKKTGRRHRRKLKASKRDKRKKRRFRKKKVQYWGHKVKLEVYSKQHKFNYLHRGTGALRVTKVSKTSEDNRYTYKEKGVKLGYSYKWPFRSILITKLSFYSRDYEEVANFGSYDRDVFGADVKYEHHLNKRWRLFLGDKYILKNYKSHLAEDATGSTVPGTLRVYHENEWSGGFRWVKKKLNIKGGYKAFSRDDIYAGYWSYDQGKTFLEIEIPVWKSAFLDFSYSIANRQYKLETNPQGEIRDRHTSNLDLGIRSENSWGDLAFSIELKDQKDKDAYYTYKKNIYSISYIKSF